MKKALVLLLAALMLVAMVSCGDKKAQETTPSTGTVDAEFDPNKVVEFVQQTNDTNRIVTIGTVNKADYQQPILVTSFGQSTDAAMIDTVMKKLGVNYNYNATANASSISTYKTIVIAVGASTKGLGAAGISEDQETSRAKEFMEAAKKSGAKIICVHIGGSSRRGKLSDTLTDLVLPASSYIVLKEDANFDYKFTNYAEKNNVPISLIFANKDSLTVFENLLK